MMTLKEKTILLTPEDNKQYCIYSSDHYTNQNLWKASKKSTLALKTQYKKYKTPAVKMNE